AFALFYRMRMRGRSRGVRLRSEYAAEFRREPALDVIDEGEGCWHDHEGERGRGDEATDHGDGHGLTECGVTAEPEGHRQHPRNHGDGRHHDRAGALVARLEDRSDAVLAGAHLLDGKVD